MKLAVGVVVATSFWAARAHAVEPIEGGAPLEDGEDAPAGEAQPPERGEDPWGVVPAPSDAPQLRNVHPRKRWYIDGSIAQSGDLSALPYIQGSGRNLRATAGGSYHWGKWQIDGELPASQATTLDLTQIPGGEPIPEDQHQTALSIGDLRAGVQWSTAPWHDKAFELGWGLRVRVPTHTTRFQFHLNDGSLGVYSFPYYFHLEPAILAGGVFGPLSFEVNQGALILIGPDGNFEDVYIVVPTIYYWDAHYAASFRLGSAVALSGEISTTIQLNHVAGMDFAKLNDVVSVVAAPALQFVLGGGYRLDAVVRMGLTKGAELMGVIGYAGTNAVLLRLTRYLD